MGTGAIDHLWSPGPVPPTMLYMEVIDDVVSCSNTDVVFPDGSIEQRYQSRGGEIGSNLVIGGVGVHEATHAIDPQANKIGFPMKEDKAKREIKAIENEEKHIKSLK